MSNKDIRLKRSRIPAANSCQNQIARLIAIACNIERFPGRCAGNTVQNRRRPVFQFRQFAFRFIQQPARFFPQTVGIKGGMSIFKIALLQSDNLHVVAHINKCGYLIEYKCLGGERKFKQEKTNLHFSPSIRVKTDCTMRTPRSRSRITASPRRMRSSGNCPRASATFPSRLPSRR